MMIHVVFYDLRLKQQHFLSHVRFCIKLLAVPQISLCKIKIKQTKSLNVSHHELIFLPRSCSGQKKPISRALRRNVIRLAREPNDAQTKRQIEAHRAIFSRQIIAVYGVPLSDTSSAGAPPIGREYRRWESPNLI